MWAVPENAESLWVSACRATFDVNGGGKVDHMGGSIVGLRLSTFRGNVRPKPQSTEKMNVSAC